MTEGERNPIVLRSRYREIGRHEYRLWSRNFDQLPA